MNDDLTTILTSYRLLLQSLPCWDAAAFMDWVEEVSFWLARIQDVEAYQQWALIFAMDLQQKGGRPLDLCLGVLERHVVQAMEIKP